jgi:peptide deformylase
VTIIDVPGLRILMYPAPSLRWKAAPIERIDETVRAVAARMFELVREVGGVGLAAPQVGLSWRMFVTACDEEEERVFVNPRLALSGLPVVREEGCLSLPGINVDIRRPVAATVTALGLDGREFTLQGEDLSARIWQHELDHLDGILIIDRMSPMDRIATRKALRGLEASATGGRP